MERKGIKRHNIRNSQMKHEGNEHGVFGSRSQVSRQSRLSLFRWTRGRLQASKDPVSPECEFGVFGCWRVGVDEEEGVSCSFFRLGICGIC